MIRRSKLNVAVATAAAGTAVSAVAAVVLILCNSFCLLEGYSFHHFQPTFGTKTKTTKIPLSQEQLQKHAASMKHDKTTFSRTIKMNNRCSSIRRNDNRNMMMTTALFMNPPSSNSNSELHYANVDQTSAEYIDENYSEKLPLPELEEEEEEEECTLDTTPESLAYLLEEEIVHHVEELVLEEEHQQQMDGVLSVLPDDHLYEEIVEDGETLPLEEFIEQTHVNVSDSIISSWEPDTAQLIVEMMKEQSSKRDYSQKPFMVGIVGIPGSGKTTSCTLLSELVDNSIVVPMDGYHLSMKELHETFGPHKAEDAIYRRGAPDTFNPSQLQQNLDKILRHTSESKVHFPGFDHHIGDPVPNEHTFTRGEHEVVICEGIYLLHDDDGWNTIKDNFDFTIYIESDVDFCIDRLKVRNTCIPGYTVDEIHERCDKVDRTNALTVQSSRQYANHIVVSAFGKPASEIIEEEEFQEVRLAEI